MASKKKWFGIAAVVAAIGAGVAVVVAKSKMTRDSAAVKMDETVNTVVEASKSAMESATNSVESAKSSVVKTFAKKAEKADSDMTDEIVEETTPEAVAN